LGSGNFFRCWDHAANWLKSIIILDNHGQDPDPGLPEALMESDEGLGVPKVSQFHVEDESAKEHVNNVTLAFPWVLMSFSEQESPKLGKDV
jgi:hypothetical protein